MQLENSHLLAALAVIFGLVLAAIARPLPGAGVPDAVPEPQPDDVTAITPEITPEVYQEISPVLRPDSNITAFLDMIAYAEGTEGSNGYRTLFGGGLFDSFADHPRRVFDFTNSKGERLKTSAAGRYQFLARTWDGLRAKLGLQDFTPASQDAGAIELIRAQGALGDVRAGRIATAVRKCAPVWASLPGAGYNQPERKYTQLVAAYKVAGGQITA